MNSPVMRRAIAAYESGAWAEAEAACAEVLRRLPDQADARCYDKQLAAILPLLEP